MLHEICLHNVVLRDIHSHNETVVITCVCPLLLRPTGLNSGLLMAPWWSLTTNRLEM